MFHRGGVAGPAGPAKAGPLFSGSLDSLSDCRDSLRTRRLGQVSYASPPLPCMYNGVARQGHTGACALATGGRAPPMQVRMHLNYRR